MKIGIVGQGFCSNEDLFKQKKLTIETLKILEG